MRRVFVLWVTVLCVLMAAGPARSQPTATVTPTATPSVSGNLLLNPGFEDGFVLAPPEFQDDPSYIRYHAVDWSFIGGNWWNDSGESGGVSHTGSHSQAVGTSWGTLDNTIYQRAPVTPGTGYRFSAWTRIDCNDVGNDHLRRRIAIDPTGGTDPNAPAVVRGVWVWDEELWQNQYLDFFSQASWVTVFVQVETVQNYDWQWLYVDDAFLLPQADIPTPTITPTPPPWSLAISNIQHQPNPVSKFGKLEITFDLSETYSNPYDTDEIDVRVEFLEPGSGSALIPAFWYQGYNRVYSGGNESYVPNGLNTWMARLMGRGVGTCQYRILASDAGGSATSEWHSFECVDSAGRGLIRLDNRNPRYLRYENGDPYLPVGHNLCWGGGGGAGRVTEWLTRMQAVGENWTRYWMVPFVGQGLEWKAGGYYGGLGRYSQQMASRFDGMVDAANGRGVAVQFCMDSFNGWNYSVYSNWAENPYSTVNGGMLSRPIGYFSDPSAKNYARKRFRYIIARWAYSPAILCWEFWNEADIIGAGGPWDGTYHANRTLGAQWHQEMAQYLHSVDPYDHLITTSFSNDPDPLRFPEIWELPEMDVVECHRYSNSSPSAHISLVEQGKAYDKPVILGEFGLADVPSPSKPMPAGIDPRGALLMSKMGALSVEIAYADPTGQTLHDVIWPAAVVESGGMSWWWDNWIDPGDLYHVFQPLSTYLQNEDWAPLGLYGLSATVLSGHSVDVYGSQGTTHAFLWVQDPAGGTVTGLQLRLDGMDTAEKEIEYWNTYTGAVVGSATVSSPGGSVILSFPTFGKDMAVKVGANPPGVPLWRVY